MLINKNRILLIFTIFNIISCSNIFAAQYENEEEKELKSELAKVLAKDLSNIVMDYVKKPEYYYLFGNPNTECFRGRYNFKGRSEAGITKYLSDGKIVKNFDITFRFAKINSIAIQPDGKILATGSQAGAEYPRSIDRTYIMRYMPDGKLDNLFGDYGIEKKGYYEKKITGNYITLQNNNKILISLGNRNFICRYEPNGILDKTFGQEGIIPMPNLKIRELQVLNDDRFIVLVDDLKKEASYIYRFLENGILDKSLIFGLTTSTTKISAIKLQNDNKLIVSLYSNKNSDFLRFLENGFELDSSFDNSKVKLNFVPELLNIQDDGKILAVGNYRKSLDKKELKNIKNGDSLRGTFSRFGWANIHFLKIIRLNPDGLLDNDFGNSGIVMLNILGNINHFQILSFDQFGNIIIGGSQDAELDEGDRDLLIKLKPDGSIDKNFNNVGLASLNTFEI